MNTNTLTNAHDLPLEQIGWRYYNTIRKKAMEQEFSWSGLWLNLSIAFFIVIFAAFSLSLLYNSLSGATFDKLIIGNNSKTEHRLEYLPIKIGNTPLERIETLNLA